MTIQKQDLEIWTQNVIFLPLIASEVFLQIHFYQILPSCIPCLCCIQEGKLTGFRILCVSFHWKVLHLPVIRFAVTYSNIV